MLCRGKPISPELLKAIEESRFAVVVFSKNYANSSWCLDELVKIMECQERAKVLPVFFHVDPSDVRGQKQDYATAFKQHEEKFRGKLDKLNKWRKALAEAANLSGYHISEVSGGESAFINKIVHDILSDIQPRARENNLIGIESHMDALDSLLKIEAAKEVRTIGIFGMGGIGKTTIAHALFRKISHKFEGCSFITNVRDSASKKDICALQEKMLRDVLVTHHGFMIQDPEYGAEMIQERFCYKKVLLVLDGVNDVKQLQFLAATHDWFGPGSRIIITTRDEHLLSDANAKYKPVLLLMDQAVELFSIHAFRKKGPPHAYKELTDRVIRYTAGLPLALKALGSFFHGRQIGVWKSALDRLTKIPNSEIFETLRLSFDDLNVYEQKIFLDIACFFKGKKAKYVTRMLDSFGFEAVIGISVLMEKSLITISNKKLGMHDLIQEMGWQIVRESFPSSRFQQLEEIHDFIKKNKKLTAIEAIVMPFKKPTTSEAKLDDDQFGESLGFRADVFQNMKNLRLLIVNREFTSREPTCLPDELRWLCWHYYPFPSLPLSNMHKLVGFELSGSKIKHLWTGQKIMQNLKFIHLSRLQCLTRLPDVTGCPNVERLILSRCTNLVEAHESLGFLKRIVYLKMNRCRSLKFLPSSLEMESLETLNISSCQSLTKFPAISSRMVKLSRIKFIGCSMVKGLPSSIKLPYNLKLLEVTDCTGLFQSIPEVTYLDDSLCFQYLRILDYRFFKQPAEVIYFHALRKLDLHLRQIGEEDFPNDLHRFSALEVLIMSGNSKLIQLPASISQLSSLRYLELNKCFRLQNLHGLPSGIQVLRVIRCRSLEKTMNMVNL